MNKRLNLLSVVARHWEILLLVIGWALYLIVKLVGPLLVVRLFDGNSWTLLNTLTTSHEQQTLDYYQGLMQDLVFGPIIQTLSFVLLALMLWRYCRNVSLKVFALIIFVFLLITKWEVLSFPPYGDAIGGPFAEALWLFEHNFDYVGLFHQPTFTVGGPRVYFFSIYPGFLALTLKVIPWTQAFLVFHHLLTFALTAGIIAMVRECGRKVFEPVLAMLLALILLALPLFQSQTEAINMEMPVTFFVVWAAYAFVHQRWAQGAALAAIAATVKGLGIIACGSAVVLICFGAWRMVGLREKLKSLAWALVPAITGIFIVSAKFIFHDTHVQQGMVQLDAGWPSLKKEFIFYLFLLALAIFVFHIVRLIIRKKPVDIFIPAIFFLFSAGWFMLFFNFYAVSPRYRVTLFPFLVFCAAYAIALVFQLKIVQRIVAVIVIVAACVCSYGGFYGGMSENDHVLLERSLEYRNDLILNRRLIQAAQERYSDQLIVAPFTIAQALAIPQLGYVHKKLKVMMYGFGIKYGNIANYPGLKNLNLRRTVFVGVKVAPISEDFSYPVGPHDFILEKIAVGNKEASFFRGGVAIESLWRVTHGVELNK